MEKIASHGRNAVPFGQGLRRERAALYVGVSSTKFDELVGRGIMPMPRRIDRCVIWLRDELDAALFALPDGEGTSPYDEVAA